MPELPEVETIRSGLARLLPGLVVAKVSYDWPKSFPNSPNDVEAFLIGASITKVARRAKVLLIELSSKYSLVIHLKMTGQLVFVQSGGSVFSGEQNIGAKSSNGPSRTVGAVKGVAQASSRQAATSQSEPATCSLELNGGEKRWGGGHPSDSLVGSLPDKSTRVIIELIDGSKLFFNDQRKFGWIKLIPTAEVPNIDFMKRVGPEPLEASFTSKVLATRLARRPNTSIKAALLDQSVLAGLGNIYVDESLWAARIHSATLTKHVSRNKINNLHKAINQVLELAIASGGSTDRNYVDAEGQKGSYLRFAKVFRREGEPCPRCKHEIVKIRVAGRGTHVCPHCQKQVTR